MDAAAEAAEWFIGVFQLGGEWFVGVAGSILPTLIVLLTAVNALVSFVGQDRLDRFAALAGREGVQYTFIRYLALPVVAVFTLTNPMCYSMGTFVPERNKPAFYDAAVSFVHPITGLFPHANAAELFVYLGIAAGVEALGFGLGQLALRYLIVGMIVIYIRGLVTQFIVDRMSARREAAAATA